MTASRPGRLAAVLTLLCLGLCAMEVFSPEIFYDSLVYHLALPQEYLRVGRLHAPDGIIYSHFPQNGEMLFTLALQLGSDLLAQMFVWLASALTVAWLLTFGRRITPAAPFVGAVTTRPPAAFSSFTAKA